MRLGTFLCGLGALFAAVLANGRDTAEAWTDEAIWITVAETYGFERKLEATIFHNQNVRDHIRRAGVVPACRMIADFVDRRAEAACSSYRSHVVAEARAMVPEATTFQEQISITPTGHRFGRLVERVERNAPELFAELPAQIETELATDLANLTTIKGEWRGLFTDWNFDGSNQSVWATACMISNLRDPSNAKGAFDGFYRERLAQ